MFSQEWRWKVQPLFQGNKLDVEEEGDWKHHTVAINSLHKRKSKVHYFIQKLSVSVVKQVETLARIQMSRTALSRLFALVVLWIFFR